MILLLQIIQLLIFQQKNKEAKNIFLTQIKFKIYLGSIYLNNLNNISLLNNHI